MFPISSIFKFKLPGDAKQLDLPIGATLLVRGPNCDHDGKDAIRPYTSITDNRLACGYLELLCKRYDSWGVKESRTTHFLFTRTDHSYRPPGALSNYLHRLLPGQLVDFKREYITVVCVDLFFESFNSVMCRFF